MKRESILFRIIFILSVVVFTTTKAKALFDNERYGMKRIVDGICTNPNMIDVEEDFFKHDTNRMERKRRRQNRRYGGSEKRGTEA